MKIIVLLLVIFSLDACSSAPKKPPEVFNVRDLGAAHLELANRETDRGNYDAALQFLALARRAALSTDDPLLRVKTGLLRGNILLYQGDGGEANAAWEAARVDAGTSGDAELAAACNIHVLFGQLMLAIREKNTASVANDVRQEAAKELGKIKKDREEIAFGWVVCAMAEKELARYAEAEASAKKALVVHLKDNFLEKAAYDWYVIASIRSLAKNYDDALKALDEAIALDRRAENSWGLASAYHAKGEVYTKAGDSAAAGAAFARSEEISQSLSGE